MRACYVLEDTNAAADLWIRTVLKFLISSAVMTPMEWNAGQNSCKYLALGSCTIQITRMDRALISSHRLTRSVRLYSQSSSTSSSIIRHGSSSSRSSSSSSSRFSSIIRHGSSSRSSCIHWGSSSRSNSFIIHGGSSSRSSFIT